MPPSTLNSFDRSRAPTLLGCTISGHSNAPAQAEVARSSNKPVKADLLEEWLTYPEGAQAPPRVAQAKEYANELRLGNPGEPYNGLSWQVSTFPLKRLTVLPKWREHSGSFEWIGPEKHGLPRYLWDSHEFRTVEADPKRLKDGYIAVSWTWGRYQLQGTTGPKWRQTKGTDWKVPELPPVIENGYHGVKHLKYLLRQIPESRYFWVDVLCIDQGEGKAAEKQQEISKQAPIFSTARCVISYLWTLEGNHLGQSLSALGGLLSRVSQFDHKHPERYPILDLNGQRIPLPSFPESADQFKRLRDDHWFTSLWALQEIILAPAGLWMTRDGQFCKVNGELLTTRFFAIAIRLLWLVYQFRESRWDEAEKRYMASRGMSSEKFHALKGKFGSERHRRQQALREVLKKQHKDGQGYEVLIVESKSADQEEPWVIHCRRKESPLRQHVFQWTDWAYGPACIDVALEASRATILLAGKNRHVVDKQSRELALLAALKIGHHRAFIPPDVPDGSTPHFSTNLLNVILRVEEVKIFDIIHKSSMPSFTSATNNDINDLDYEAYDPKLSYICIQDKGEFVPPQPDADEAESSIIVWTHVTSETEHVDSSTEYKRNGQTAHIPALRARERLLTNMSPCSARSLNYQVSRFTSRDDITWVPHHGWHFHDFASLHVPSTALVQIRPKRSDGTRLRFRPNGGRVEYDIDRLSDEKLIYRTQPWMKETLGKPQFILLQLGYRQSRKRTANTTPMASLYEFVEKPEVMGVVLVGKESLRRDTSMTRWHKFGTYNGWGESRPLSWRDGILVVSLPDEQKVRTAKTADCDALEQMRDTIWKTLAETDMHEEGYAIVQHDEILSNFSSPSTSPIREHQRIFPKTCR